MSEKWIHKSAGIPDAYFIRGKVPMTKEEVRAVTLSKLRIEDDSIVLDIGAGTGSVSVETAIQAPNGKVYAVEKNLDGIELIKENQKQFDLDNIKTIHGMAPEACPESIKYNRIFMGGTSGKMLDILKWCKTRLTEKGRIVVNTITIENTYRAIEAFKELEYKNIDVAQVQVSKGRFVGSVTMMESNNPVYIISAEV